MEPAVQDTRVTEVSLFYHLSSAPTTPIDRSIPFVVDARDNEIQRIVGKTESINAIPDWVIHPKTTNMRFIYAMHEQDVECTYYVGKGILACTGVRFHNMGALRNNIDTLFNILGTSSDKECVLYKASSVVHIQTAWDRDVFADILTNDYRVSQYMAVNEGSGTLGTKKLLPVNVFIGESCVRAIVSPCLNPCAISVKISRLPRPETADVVMSAFHEVFEIYNLAGSALGPVNKYSSTDHDLPLKGIDALRREVPELFIKNYTRECPVLPLIVPKAAVNILDRRIIFYPKDNPVYGRYYTAPDGLFVGLKRNRLANKDVFPYLITCYVSDHMQRHNSDTYIYYTGNIEHKRAREYTTYRQVPRCISTMDTRYSRVGICKSPDSLLAALENATGMDETHCATFRESLVWAPQLVKQELWDEDDDTIMNAIRGDNYASGSLIYRYFEELLHISIDVIVIRDGKFDSLLPRHIKPYIWSPPYPMHVVIFENIKTTYGKREGFHEILMRRDDKSMLLDANDMIVSSIINDKLQASIRPKTIGDAVAQLIDDDGKCRMIKTSTGDIIPTFSRPIAVPTMHRSGCFIDDHIIKMNQIREKIGLRAAYTTKGSTRHVRYFPNDRSFKVWIDKVK